MESLARGGPWRLGVVLRGKSKWRALSEAETENYGGSSLRRLYGCVFNIQRIQTRPPGDVGRTRSDSETATNEPVREYEQQLLTWSQVLQSPVFRLYSIERVGCLRGAQLARL